eukprot:TRINITY_DN3637_c0_g1_i2.p1 TRINITY_DN3637_c0_g1~~TRINITY_DN3637_c0_g1_i2.p1  ORF type:complete len:365 (-),score=42.77 TRINITY_DN3637_c0_g1_i2:142-1155(-)
MSIDTRFFNERHGAKYHGLRILLVASTVIAFSYILPFLKTQLAPIFNFVEHTIAGRIMLFVLLVSTPEPSPIVVLLAAFIVFYPLHDLWQRFSYGMTFSGLCYLWAPLVINITYWSNGLLLFALEAHFSDLLNAFRIQSTKRFDTSKFWKLVTTVGINFFLVMPFVSTLAYVLILGGGGGLRIEPELPGPLEMFLHMIYYLLWNEVLFFYGHWMMHANTWLYRKVHKIHHEFTAPCALAAIYCHPVEFVISDFIPLGVGCFLLNSHAFTFCVWCVFAVLGTQTHHCGFRWPWIASWDHQPNFHDMHHQRFTVNFGQFGFLDTLHDTKYVKSVCGKDE